MTDLPGPFVSVRRASTNERWSPAQARLRTTHGPVDGLITDGETVTMDPGVTTLIVWATVGRRTVERVAEVVVAEHVQIDPKHSRLTDASGEEWHVEWAKCSCGDKRLKAFKPDVEDP